MSDILTQTQLCLKEEQRLVLQLSFVHSVCLNPDIVVEPRLFKLRRVSYCLLYKKVNICLFNSKGLLSWLSENKVVKIFPIKSSVSYWKHFIFITVLNGILCPLELEHGLIGLLNGQRIT